MDEFKADVIALIDAWRAHVESGNDVSEALKIAQKLDKYSDDFFVPFTPYDGYEHAVRELLRD